MNKTQIEWVKNPDGTQGFTWNPITGCLNHVNGMCKGGGFPCYAYRLANTRLRERYLANNNTASMSDFPDIGYSKLAAPFYPRLWPERMRDLTAGFHKPKGVFVCDMSDLFGTGIPEEWQTQIFTAIRWHPEDRFYLLTKQSQNLIKFSPFPDNCYVGVTATNWLAFSDALGHLATITAKVKFLSFEPLLERIQFDMMQELLFPKVINWVIIGAQTKPTVMPKIEYVEGIVSAADQAGIPVFLKENLSDLIPVNSNLRYGPAGELRLRQELPQ